MTTTERPERSVPKPVFTDAEAGAREFPDSGPGARRYNYFTPAKRKQTHYEDVTVDVQPDPRHYLSQGWIYGFANGETGYPLHWTKLKAWGVDLPEPTRGTGSGGMQVQNWPAHGWHEFRDPNEEWEQTLYRYNANVVRQLNQNVENARNAKAFDFWATNCAPCLEEMPKLKQLYEEFHGRGFDILGISLDEDERLVESFREQAKLPWRQVMHDAEGAIGKPYGVPTIPALFLLNRKGEVVHFDLKGDDLRTVVSRLIETQK